MVESGPLTLFSSSCEGITREPRTFQLFSLHDVVGQTRLWLE